MCQGKTKSGKVCKNKTEPYCHLHEDQVLPVAVPWELSKKIERKILTKVKKGPSKSDGPGRLYIYHLDSAEPYIKIGMTERTSEKRLKEWKGAKLIVDFAAKHRRLTERLVHLYLDHVRVYRYVLENGAYYTIWKNSREPVEENGPPLHERLKGISKQVEWFKISYPEIKGLIEALTCL